jgi:hypothetical protein
VCATITKVIWVFCTSNCLFAQAIVFRPSLIAVSVIHKLRKLQTGEPRSLPVLQSWGWTGYQEEKSPLLKEWPRILEV